MLKQRLRQQIRLRKRQMTEYEIREKSEALMRLLLQTEAYQNAKSIYAYLPFNQEVRTEPILRRALLDGKLVALPKITEGQMRFVAVTELDQVTISPMGCPEPIADVPVARDASALVLMPGLAFDLSGRRLGYGGGYYDRFLSSEPGHPTIALCYDFQLLPEIPVEAQDVPVDLVLWA